MNNETVIKTNPYIEFPTLKTDYNKERWRLESKCRGEGNTKFFNDRKGGASAYFDARCICYGCPVKQQCLDFAIDNSIKDGMWGGLTYRDRLRYARGERDEPITIFDLVKGLRGPKQTISALAQRLSISEDQIRNSIRKRRKP